MNAPALSAPLSLRELAVKLGPPWNAARASSLRRLRRLLVRTGSQLGQVLYHCAGARSAGYVTLAELRAHMPELFDRQSELAALVREHVDDLKDACAVLRETDRELARRLVRLEGRLSAVER